ncbi:MAG: DNA recombination protein RmuC, partial [Acidobacteriota bacterium]
MVDLLPALLVGGVVGFLLAWLASRTRIAKLDERLRWSESERERLVDQAASATRLERQVTELRARHDSDVERLAWIHTADEQLRLAFRDLAAEALERTAGAVRREGDTERKLAETRMRDAWREQHQALDGIVGPLRERLDRLDQEVRGLEQQRRTDQAGLQKEIALLRDAHGDLRGLTAGLAAALRAPGVRGKWGEMQLRRIVELAGMAHHVDFLEQPSTADGLRPDLLVQLPHGAVLPIDAKTPLEALLASDQPDPQAHVRNLRARVSELAAKRYWRQFDQAPDFVVMFIASEAALAVAFEHDPDLLDHALARRVLPATPVTLLALLKAVAYGWQQQRIAADARRIASLGQDLHDRLTTFVDHLGKVGQGLSGAVTAFNRAIGSFDRRVLPAARKLGEHGAAVGEVGDVETVDTAI